VKWFLTSILATLVLLSILVGVYAGLFNDERLRRTSQEKKSMEMMGDQKVEAVRLGYALHQQEAEREHQESDTKRALKRIMSVVTRTFDELAADSKMKLQAQPLKEAKATIVNFVDQELKDFEKDKKAYDTESKKLLERLALLQEQSLRDLLKSVSGVKMEAMEDMLEDVFAAGQRAPTLDVTDKALEEVESLADSMYEGKTSLEKGRERLGTIRLQINGELPEEITKSLSTAKSANDFAQTLDELIEIAELARGKKEIAMIETTWRKNVGEARAANEGAQEDENEDEDDENYDEEIKHNVDALLAIHKLVAEGKVPVYLLDFEAIDMKDLQNNDNDDDEENDQNDQNDQNVQSDPDDQNQNEDGDNDENDENKDNEENNEENDNNQQDNDQQAEEGQNEDESKQEGEQQEDSQDENKNDEQTEEQTEEQNQNEEEQDQGNSGSEEQAESNDGEQSSEDNAENEQKDDNSDQENQEASAEDEKQES